MDLFRSAVQCCGGMGMNRAPMLSAFLILYINNKKQYSCDCANRYRVLLQCVFMAIMEPFFRISLLVFQIRSCRVCVLVSHSGVKVNRTSSLLFFFLLWSFRFSGGQGSWAPHNRPNTRGTCGPQSMNSDNNNDDNNKRISDSLYGKPCLCFKVFIFYNVMFDLIVNFIRWGRNSLSFTYQVSKTFNTNTKNILCNILSSVLISVEDIHISVILLSWTNNKWPK